MTFDESYLRERLNGYLRKNKGIWYVHHKYRMSKHVIIMKMHCSHIVLFPIMLKLTSKLTCIIIHLFYHI